jgi:DNA-binding beta-propeller fold protein YncE
MIGRLSLGARASLWARASILVLAAAVSNTVLPGQAAAAGTRAPIWSDTYKRFGATATAIAVDPSDRTVFVGGAWFGRADEFLVGAYATDTGYRRWIMHVPSGAAYGGTWTMDLAVSPDGAALYLTGIVKTSTYRRDVVTMSLDPSTRTVMWTATSSGANDYNAPTMRLAPTGDRIYVAMPVGRISDPLRRGERVLAYDAATGHVVWQVRIGGVASASPQSLLAVSPDGSRIFVSVTKAERLKTVALDATTGGTVWLRRFGRLTAHNLASDIVTAPDGAHLYVSDYRWGTFRGDEMIRWPVILAYDPEDGTQLWKNVVKGAISDNMHIGLAASADHVFVTNGYAVGDLGARHGLPGWVTPTVTLPGYWTATDFQMALSPDDSRLFLIATLLDDTSRVETAAVATATGALKWTASRKANWGKVATGSNGTRVYVAGTLPAPFTDGGYRAWYAMAYGS